VAGALIMERDGIVGSWQGPTLAMNQRTIEKVGNLKDWEPWVRAAIIDFDLLSNLYFSRHDETIGGANVPDAVTVWSLNVAASTSAANPVPAASPSRIATFIRPGDQVFKDQLKFLDEYSDLREDRAAEILAQLGPQYAFWSSIVYLHPDKTRKTIELIDAALRLANYVEMRVKHALACRRPNELSPQVQPIILTPGHGTFPSGHSTENHMVARILWELRGQALQENPYSPDVGEQLMRAAARIAVNRTVAGVHFPVDTAAGQVLGLALARYFIVRATGVAPAQYDAWRFDGTLYPGNGDFDVHDFYNPETGAENPNNLAYIARLNSTAPAQSNILKWLWTEAADEWKTA
jgi:hypothetical protein